MYFWFHAYAFDDVIKAFDDVMKLKILKLSDLNISKTERTFEVKKKKQKTKKQQNKTKHFSYILDITFKKQLFRRISATR